MQALPPSLVCVSHATTVEELSEEGALPLESDATNTADKKQDTVVGASNGELRLLGVDLLTAPPKVWRTIADKNMTKSRIT